jgi:hypothetical protein
MSKGAVSADDYPLRELREYIAGNLDVEHEHVSPAALIEDKKTRQAAIFMEQAYEPPKNPDGSIVDGFPPADKFWETEFAKRILRTHVSDKAARILREGDKDGAASITGLVNHEPDISGMAAVNRLADWLIRPNQVLTLYLAGNQGAGKTDFSLTMLEVVDRYYDRAASLEDVNPDNVPEPDFAANFSVEAAGDTECDLINTYGGLVEWLDGGNSDQEKWFVFDEASTELTAQSSSNAQKVVEKMNELTKKARKKGLAGWIVVGHDGKDCAPLFRKLADYVHKTDTKKAEFYASVDDREGQGHLFDLTGIPKCTWSYDTDDEATWHWSDGDQATGGGGYTDDELRDLRDERMARLYEQVDITQDELADAFDVSRSTVTRAVNDD